MAIVLYGLYDPKEPERCRYVGQTKRPRARYNRHILCAVRGEQTHKANWIRLVLREGRNIEQRALAIVYSENDANAAERWFVKSMRDAGHDLTNVTDGGYGGGVRGVKRSDEFRLRISEARKGKPLSEVHRRKLSLAHRGKTLTEEHRQKIAAANRGIRKPKSIEHRRKISETLKRRAIEQVQLYG